MGMDQWIFVKTTSAVGMTPTTGAACGLLPVTPNIDGYRQLGYLRKAYEQDSCILIISDIPVQLINVKTGEVSPFLGPMAPLRIDKRRWPELADYAAHVLATHTFDEEGYDTTDIESDPDSDWALINSQWYTNGTTYQTAEQWKLVQEICEKAQRILQDDPDAEFCYFVWN